MIWYVSVYGMHEWYVYRYKVIVRLLLLFERCSNNVCNVCMYEFGWYRG